MMCEDEKSYQAYLAYLDAVEKSGKAVNHEEAMAAVMKAMEEAARAAWNRDPWADAADDKTLSTGTPFVCAPVEK
jgi:hypothetical protein